MKRLIIFTAALFLSTAGYAAVQYHNIGNVKMSSSTVTGSLGISGAVTSSTVTVSGGLAITGSGVKTLAQIDLLTPYTTNQLVVCSNCLYKLCISSGADSGRIGAFVVVGSTVTTADSASDLPLHCQ